MKILVDAYVEKNLGDDLFLKILFDRYPSQVEWFVTCDSEDELKAFETYTNVKGFNKKIHKYKDFDGVINIGGSIFMQSGNWWIRQLFNRLTYAIPMKLRNKPLFIIGCNYGPSTNKLMDRLNHLFMKLFVTDISFRDKESYNMFGDIKQARYNPDIVYGLDTAKFTNIERNNNKFGICIMSFSDKKINNDFINKVVEITKELCEENYEVEFYSFCEKQNDLDTYNKIQEILGESYKNKISHYMYEGNLTEYLTKFNSLSYIITLRFHSLILAQIFKMKYYPIVYSKKTSNVLHDQDYKGKYTKIENVQTLNVENIISEVKQNNHSLNSTIKNEATNHFAEIDKFLRKLN
ncbi:polysaccharide pyruvyl transferase family protein [Priestia megaterium]|uniref:polysaccharide pyruvyl transferase family protein n=1 Tax=Priestia megaterium TaxID=1404 RepID=UPI0015CF024B|nr:polysaccharide pyruvyl transferase family protein [Priestia megaterium]